MSAAEIERLADADTRFFEENPGRRYRLRPAQPVEIATGFRDRDPAPSGFTLYVVVRQLCPGLRAHAFLMGGPDAHKPEASEAEARDLFASASAPGQPTFH